MTMEMTQRGKFFATQTEATISSIFKGVAHGNIQYQRELVVPSEILWYFLCSGSLIQDRSFESLRTFGRGDFKCSGPCAVANSHDTG